MFGIIGSILGGATSIAGSVVGASLNVIASTLNITEKMVKEAIDAGCKTEKEIREYWNL